MIKKVLICGLGALGLTYANKLKDICELKILANTERVNKYKQNAPIFNNKKIELDYITPDINWYPDLIIISTKSTGLNSALEYLKNFVHENTIIISLINGISSEEIISYTNRILNLNHISAIRRENKKEVLFSDDINDLKQQIINDVNILKKEYQSIAIITKTDEQTENLFELIKNDIDIFKMGQHTEEYKRDLIILPSYIAKGLEFDAVIVYTDKNDSYTESEKYLFYVACTRAQHQLIVYNQNNGVFFN